MPSNHSGQWSYALRFRTGWLTTPSSLSAVASAWASAGSDGGVGDEGEGEGDVV